MPGFHVRDNILKVKLHFLLNFNLQRSLISDLVSILKYQKIRKNKNPTFNLMALILKGECGGIMVEISRAYTQHVTMARPEREDGF